MYWIGRLFAASALALTLAACGGEGAPPAPQATSPTPTTAAPPDAAQEEPAQPPASPTPATAVTSEIVFDAREIWREIPAEYRGHGFWQSALNDRGEVAGPFGAADTGVWSGGAWRVLEHYDWGGDHINLVQEMNDAGWVAGNSRHVTADGVPESETVIWRPDGSLAANLGTLSLWSWVSDLNDRNEAVGQYGLNTRHVAFYRWDESGFTDLGTLGEDGVPAGGFLGAGIRVDDDGAIAFNLDTAQGLTTFVRDAAGSQRRIDPIRLHDFTGGWLAGCAPVNGIETPALWSAASGLVLLDPQRRAGCAVSVNRAGEAVGRLSGAGGELHFLYRDARLQDLQDLLPAAVQGPVVAVHRINDAGQILLQTDRRDDDGGAVLLLPRQPR